jgi:flavodoxin
MNIKKISRRKFIASIAATTGAALLVACVPVNSAPQSGNETTIEPIEEENLPRSTSDVRMLTVVIVYDTVYGNTAKIAEAMFEGFGGNQSSLIRKAQDASADDLAAFDLLIVGSPTHAGTFIEPVKNFLAGIPAGALLKVKAAAFDTSYDIQTQGAFLRFIMNTFGYAAPKIGKKLSEMGAAVLATETFIVLDTEGPLQEGEEKRAKEWASAVIKKVLES